MSQIEHASWAELEKRPYPEHIYDPIRIGIATELIEKELLRITPSLSEQARQELEGDIKNWVDGRKVNLAPIHDFWNGFDGITRGFKLKNFLPNVTAENISWKRTNIPIDSITTTAELPIMEPLGNPPYDVKALKDALAGPILYQDFKQDSDYHSAHPIPRDHYPVLLLRQGEIVKTLDGNRRVIRAAVYERETIDAWVGTLAATERPRNYWVTTGYLRELVRLAEEKESDELTTAVSKVLETLFNESEIARVNFRLRSMKHGSFGEKIGKKLGL